MSGQAVELVRELVNLYGNLKYAQGEERRDIIRTARQIRIRMIEKKYPEEKSEETASDLQKRLLKRCGDGSVMNARSMARVCGVAYTGYFRQILKKLMFEGTIKRVRKGYYQIAEKSVFPKDTSTE